MMSTRQHLSAIARVLALSELQLELLHEKIANAEIEYKSTTAWLALRWIFRSFVATSRKPGQDGDAAHGMSLLCMSEASANNGVLRSNLANLFADAQPLRIEPLDYAAPASVRTVWKAAVGLLCLRARSFFSPRAKRQLIEKISLPYVQAIIQFDRLIALQPKKIIWVGNSYSLPTFFLSAWFKSTTNTISCYYVNRAFVSHQDNLAANEVLLGNIWALSVYRRAGAQFDADRITSFHNIYFPSIPAAREEDGEFRKNRIAVYCSGTYARLKLGVHTSDYLKRELEEEKLLLDDVRRMAISMPDISFTLFYHPSVETHTTAEANYQELLALTNVDLSPEGVRSSQCHHLYELGMSRGSNVIFERLEAGHKALFVRPIRQIKDYCASSLSPVILEAPALNRQVLKEFLDMPLKEFHALIALQKNSPGPQHE